MLASSIATGIIALTSQISPARELPNLKQNIPYAKARNMLINAGWKPLFNKEQVNNPNRGITINNFIEKKGYTEIVDCSGTGLGLCLFQFKNADGEKLFVTTANNVGDKETVFGWRIEQQSKTSVKVNTSCVPRDSTSRILSSPKPNDIHPNWSGNNYVGKSWSFKAKNVVKNNIVTYFKGDLYSPRGGLVNQDIFIIQNEWECK